MYDDKHNGTDNADDDGDDYNGAYNDSSSVHQVR
jgi:hypothetical protein